MDVACFCGCNYSLDADFGTCPACGEYVTLRHVSGAEARQMRAELDLLLRTGANAAGVPPHRRGLPPQISPPAERSR